jgi:hypothetical protein
MNINNIFGGFLGFIMAVSLIYLIWPPVTSFLSSITTSSPELGIFLSIAWVSFCIVVVIIVPMNLAVSDDKGEQ